MKTTAKKLIDKIATLVASNKNVTIGLVTGLVAVGLVSVEQSEVISEVVSALATILSVVL